MLRIVTLNLNYYIEEYGEWTDRMKILVELLRKNNPHIVAFQAVAKHPQRNGGQDQAFQICQELDGFQSHYFQEAQTTLDGLQQGNAIISKFPMFERRYLPISNNHHTDNTTERVITRVTFERPDGAFDFYNADFSEMEEQAIRNASEFVAHGNKNALICGDLGTSADNRKMQPLIDLGFMNLSKPSPRNGNRQVKDSVNVADAGYCFMLTPSLAKEFNKIEVLPVEDEKVLHHVPLMLELNIKL